MGTKDFNFIDNFIAYLRLKKIKKFLTKNSVILDFGCGHQAYFLKHIKNDIKEGVGIDYDVKSQIIPPNISLMKLKYTDKLPFPNEHFSQIYMLAVLEHLDINIVGRLFKEFKRILKKDGQIILTTPTPLSRPLLEYLAYKVHLISDKEVGDHKKYYNKKDIMKIADKNGFKLKNYSTFQFGLNSFSMLLND